ncbi:MAG: 16S rRNA (guanine(527)-N(7))-methyltransferase RsmG [Spirochaetaceae bacterium]|nr:16S rRNA (guanine(527)-N(7))-methyltransferase RsmG [Spirochaetaceae bacterium]
MADRILEAGLREIRARNPDLLGPGAAAKLNSYVEEIELFNPAYGLVGAKDRRELVVKHILDSLTPLDIIRRLISGRDTGNNTGDCPPGIADVGSGAGLPGIPLAIALPRCRFTLIERMGRRAAFLRNTLAVLALPNTEVEEGAVEKPAAREGSLNEPASGNRFAILTFRAFHPLEPATLGFLFRRLIPGGVLAAYKGRRKKINEEMAPVEKFTGGWEAFPLHVPFLDDERHLVVIYQP